MGMVAAVPGNVGNVGSAATIVLDWVVPAGFMSRDGDSIHVHADLTCPGNVNNKSFALSFPIGGAGIAFSGAYGALEIRAHYILSRVNSTQHRMTGAHWRYSTAGNLEVVRATVFTVDWNVANTLRFYIQGAASNDITATGLQYIFVPAP
jgi:hypothetical protein